MRNLINRTNVSAKTKGNFNNCEDFLVLVITCFTLVAVMEHLKIDSLEEFPSETVIPDVNELWTLTNEQRQKRMNEVCLEIVDKFIPFQFNSVTEKQGDQVRFIYQYAKLMKFYRSLSTVDSYYPLECFIWNMQMPSEKAMVTVFFGAGDTSFPFLNHPVGRIIPSRQLPH